ncbi:MAG: type 4a pilus biogenesis protein PilO [Pseudomonadota bacterium]|jgi:type IV pilus assembly protein PilO
MNAQEILDELQALDMQNPGAWPAWARAGASILLGIAIVAAATYFLIKPIYEEVKAARLQEQALKTEFETKQKKVAAIDAYRAQLSEMERSFGAMLKQLPSRAEVANLLNDISQTRVAASLEEELFQPQPEVPKDFYAIIPNKIVVLGDYHELGGFVSQIAALPRIVTVEDVDIRPAGGGTQGSPTQLRMTAVAQTYRYLDEEEIAANQPSAGKRGKK